MARRLIHSLFLTSLLSSLAVASPCKASSSTTALLSTTETTPDNSATSLTTSTSEGTPTTTPGDQTSTTSLTTSTSEGTPTTTPGDQTSTTSLTTSTSEGTPTTTPTTTLATSTSEGTPTTTPGDQTSTTSLTTSTSEGTPTTTPTTTLATSTSEGTPTTTPGDQTPTTTPADDTTTSSVCVETPAATPEPACTSVGQTCEAELEQICDPNISPIKNGNFESGDLCPWVLSGDNEACVYIGPNGAFDTAKTFRTSTKFKDNVYLEMYQDTWTCANSRVYCTYQWYFNKYYITPGRYVPYFRIWNGNEVIGNRYPESDADAGHWMSGSFSFDTPSSGKNRIWITAQSPQFCLDNWFAIDEISCYVESRRR